MPSALILGAGAVVGSLTDMSVLFVSLFNVLRTLLLLLGGALCGAYGRLRQLFLLVVVMGCISCWIPRWTTTAAPACPGTTRPWCSI